MKERLEEFTVDGKNFIHINLSGIKKNRDFIKLRDEKFELLTQKYALNSVYEIIEMESIMFDTETKEIFNSWLELDRPYVKHAVFTGVDGIKKIMFASLFKSPMVSIAYTREEAIERLLLVELAK